MLHFSKPSSPKASSKSKAVLEEDTLFIGAPASKSNASSSTLMGNQRAVKTVTNPEVYQEAELQQEASLRPNNLSEYMGQSALKQTLNVAIEAARLRKEPLDHLLFYGPPGLGKTSLALVLGKTMGASVQVTSAPALERPRDIVGLLMAMEPNALLFIDEIHRLNRVTEELLYSAMEDFCLDHTVGKGPTARTLRTPLPRFTLIGATTKAGALSNPLRDRFGLVLRLNFYDVAELTQIVLRSAGLLQIRFQAGAAEALARRCRGTPRIANRLLRRVRDYAQVSFSQRHFQGDVQGENNTIKALHRDTPHENEGESVFPPISITMVEEALHLFEVDLQGLDPMDRAYLRALEVQFGGGPVGLDALAATLGEDVKTLEDMVEPYLLQMGLIQRTPRGRLLSTAVQLPLLGG